MATPVHAIRRHNADAPPPRWPPSRPTSSTPASPSTSSASSRRRPGLTPASPARAAPPPPPPGIPRPDAPTTPPDLHHHHHATGPPPPATHDQPTTATAHPKPAHKFRPLPFSAWQSEPLRNVSGARDRYSLFGHACEGCGGWRLWQVVMASGGAGGASWEPGRWRAATPASQVVADWWRVVAERWRVVTVVARGGKRRLWWWRSLEPGWRREGVRAVDGSYGAGGG